MSQSKPSFHFPMPVSGVLGNRWPGILNGQAATFLSILYQLRQTQWWTPEEIQRYQFGQLQGLLDHAYKTVPLYKQRLDNIGFRPGIALDLPLWQQIPVLTRSDLQQHEVVSNNIPAAHGENSTTQSSGSTGVPVKITTTGMTRMFWQVFTLRDHEWRKRDFSCKLATIRLRGEPGKPEISPTWGRPVRLLYNSGPAGTLNLATDISTQMRWLREFNPDYLVAFPSNLLALIEYSQEQGISLPNLREVRAISETVNDRLREACREIWKVPMTDIYSTQEVGYIALQCPEHPHLHIQSENVLVEILDDNGIPCQPGQVGRVVVTSLHNFATPLIRYELQDMAEAGGPCPCGRGLPVINRVVGRIRNMVKLPNGEMHWPLTGFRDYGEITGSIRQFQFIQHTHQEIEVRLVVSKPLTSQETVALNALIQKSLAYPFNIRFTFHENIPRAPGGKFEEFISHVR